MTNMTDWVERTVDWEGEAHDLFGLRRHEHYADGLGGLDGDGLGYEGDHFRGAGLENDLLRDRLGEEALENDLYGDYDRLDPLHRPGSGLGGLHGGLDPLDPLHRSGSAMGSLDGHLLSEEERLRDIDLHGGGIIDPIGSTAGSTLGLEREFDRMSVGGRSGLVDDDMMSHSDAWEMMSDIGSHRGSELDDWEFRVRRDPLSALEFVSLPSISTDLLLIWSSVASIMPVWAGLQRQSEGEVLVESTFSSTTQLIMWVVV
ncbi:hypothetical protein BT69DRAFT_218688 [Atractiella rhizophila]|nr:hypothetical protein BT69DRAFT_218688 [Atractiella rhizophila]